VAWAISASSSASLSSFTTASVGANHLAADDLNPTAELQLRPQFRRSRTRERS